MQYLNEVELIFLWYVSKGYYKPQNDCFYFDLDQLSEFWDFRLDKLLNFLVFMEENLGMKAVFQPDENKIQSPKEIMPNLPLSVESVRELVDYKPGEKESYFKWSELEKLKNCKTLKESISIKGLSPAARMFGNTGEPGLYKIIVYLKINSFSELIQTTKNFLDNYISLYESGQLYTENKSYYSKEMHQKLCLTLFELHGNEERNNIVIPGNEFSVFSGTISPLCKDFSKFRVLEHLISMEKKQYIKLNNLIKLKSPASKAAEKAPFKLVNWNVNIALLRTHEEIKSIEGSWLRFGDLAVREDTGHAVYKNNKHNFPKDSPGFKALVLFIKNLGKKFTRKELEELCFTDKSPNEKALKVRTENLIHKSIMENLGLNEPGAAITIHGSSDTYYLGG